RLDIEAANGSRPPTIRRQELRGNWGGARSYGGGGKKPVISRAHRTAVRAQSLPRKIGNAFHAVRRTGTRASGLCAQRVCNPLHLIHAFRLTRDSGVKLRWAHRLAVCVPWHIGPTSIPRKGKGERREASAPSQPHILLKL